MTQKLIFILVLTHSVLCTVAILVGVAWGSRDRVQTPYSETTVTRDLPIIESVWTIDKTSNVQFIEALWMEDENSKLQSARFFTDTKFPEKFSIVRVGLITTPPKDRRKE